jgi:hypothetical protein
MLTGCLRTSIEQPANSEAPVREAAIAEIETLAPAVTGGANDAEEAVAAVTAAGAAANGLRVVPQKVRPPVDEPREPVVRPTAL